MLKDSWDKTDAKSLSRRMLEKVRPDESLPKRIAAAQRQFDKQIIVLDGIHGNLQKIHDSIFQKVMHAQRKNQISFARAYAQELAQTRKMLNMISTAKISLEQVKIRLDTVTEFGDIVVTLSPCMSIIKGLAPSLSEVMPHASNSMSDFSAMLGDVISGSSMNGINSEVPVGAGSQEALAIIEEAHNAMLGAAQSAFPDVPPGLATANDTVISDAGSAAVPAGASAAADNVPTATATTTAAPVPTAAPTATTTVAEAHAGTSPGAKTETAVREVAAPAAVAQSGHAEASPPKPVQAQQQKQQQQRQNGQPAQHDPQWWQQHAQRQQERRMQWRHIQQQQILQQQKQQWWQPQSENTQEQEQPLDQKQESQVQQRTQEIPT